MNVLLFCYSCLQPLMLPRQKCPFVMKKQEQKIPSKKINHLSILPKQTSVGILAHSFKVGYNESSGALLKKGRTPAEREAFRYV